MVEDLRFASTMMDIPLQVRRLLDHGARVHGSSRVVTATDDGFRERTFAEVGARAAQLAHGLRDLGVGAGDRVGTFQWNNDRHVEAYLGVPAMGAVVHPLNIRLFPEQLIYTANHAADRVVIVDNSLVPGFVKLLPALGSVEQVIVAGEADLAGFDELDVSVHSYEALIDGRATTYDWPDVDERSAAAMCYTSGTTGEPKGVVYSHRSIYLHALAVSVPDVFDLAYRDLVLAVVPQFHVLAWGLPYAAFATGCSMAMPDRFLAPEPLARFIAAARPNKAAGVPTVWAGLLQHLQADPAADISSLTDVIVGGSALPESMMAAFDAHGITALHAWGMTEMSPLGTLARPPAGAVAGDLDRYRLSQGRFVPSVEPRLIGPDGEELPWDDESVGELEVRGPWVANAYYGVDDADKFHDGWLRTGDVGVISPDGYLRLTDRSKDVIKSGGEWISSVELEGHLIAHPDVVEASVVGVPDERWGERPLAAVVIREGAEVSFEDLRQFLADKVARWQLPERWTIVAEIPKTSVGKFNKKVLRSSYAQDELDVTTLPPTAR